MIDQMSSPAPEDSFAHRTVAGRRLHLRRLGPDLSGTPVVFLHEGLGSVELWRDFPDSLLEACPRPGLVYSRYGNGWSEPLTEARPAGYMHYEALVSLPEVIRAACERAPVVVGHSDGASIALIYAGSGHPVAGLVLIAPHVFVETETIDRILALRQDFEGSDMAIRMGDYHAEPERTFLGWADVWLSDAFRSWNIEEYLPPIGCPVLLIQGTDDGYGTERQLDVIEAAVAGPAERLMIEGAGHSPHLSHPGVVVRAAARFIAALR
jgi:pimeloyl-ACP methyl ester carboxylesterase